MCAISGRLYPHCSTTTGGDFTVASCHMIMTLLTPVTDAEVWVGRMTSLRRSLPQHKAFHFGP